MNKKGLFINYILIIGVIIFSAPRIHAENIVISLKDDVRLEDNNILLGDISDISGNNTPFVNALEKMRIGELPEIDSGKRNFTQAEIMLRMKKLGLTTENVVFEGADIAVVHPMLQTITGNQLVNVVEDFIRRNMPWEPNDIMIKTIRTPDDVNVIKGKVYFDVIPVSRKQYIGKVRYCLVINVDKKVQKNVDVFLEITVFKKVLVAAQPIMRGEMLTPRNIRLVRREIESNSQDALSDPRRVIGMVAARNIQPQGIIKSEYIQMPQLVRRKEMVQVYLSSGALNIHTTGIAAEDGCLGDYIKIKNVDSKKVFFAKVIGIREVGVEMNDGVNE